MRAPDPDIVVEIDPNSGFCFGVTASISKAETELRSSDRLYCLGDLVHNSAEMERLQQNGLISIDHTQISQIPGARLLLRAHGEPPSTYRIAKLHGISLIDATCPVVLKLQQRIKHTYLTCPGSTQIVIYGKAGHAEVNGLVGQTDGTAIVVDDETALSQIDFSRPVMLYSQTTQSLEGWSRMVQAIASRMEPGVEFSHFDTICRQVSSRVDHVRRFAADHQVIIFVSGSKSSNGKVLFSQCQHANPASHIIASSDEISPDWFPENISSIGICGATSTPRWLMEQVKGHISTILYPKAQGK